MITSDQKIEYMRNNVVEDFKILRKYCIKHGRYDVLDELLAELIKVDWRF